MKLLLLILICSGLLLLSSCKEDCTISETSVCQVTPPDPNQATCTAYWETWFYDQATNSCQKIGYSGCSPVGFETQEECEASFICEVVLVKSSKRGTELLRRWNTFLYICSKLKRNDGQVFYVINYHIEYYH